MFNMKWFRRAAGIEDILSILRELQNKEKKDMSQLTDWAAQEQASTTRGSTAWLIPCRA